MVQGSIKNSANSSAEPKKIVKETLKSKVLSTEKIESDNRSGLSSSSELLKLLQENLQLTQQNAQALKKIQRWIAWQKAWGGLKILIILIPLILGFIYLPALIEKVIEPYQSLFNPSAASQSGNLKIQDLIDQFLNNSNNGGNQPVQ